MNGSAFIDSGAFIAFLDRSDRLHAATRALFSRPPRTLWSSVLVFSETYSWFLHRLGEEPARSFRGLVAELPRLRLLELSKGHHGHVLGKLDRLRGTKLTYVDASSLVWLKAHKIRTVWGTDHHLSIEGATVVPGSAP